jgi:hypothetical protein
VIFVLPSAVQTLLPWMMLTRIDIALKTLIIDDIVFRNTIVNLPIFMKEFSCKGMLFVLYLDLCACIESLTNVSKFKCQGAAVMKG